MNNINDIIELVGKVVENHPRVLVSFLAYASAATLVIAILSDTLFRKQPPEQKRAMIAPSKRR
jgi:hypothetical protein